MYSEDNRFHNGMNRTVHANSKPLMLCEKGKLKTFMLTIFYKNKSFKVIGLHVCQTMCYDCVKTNMHIFQYQYFF